MTVDKTTVQKVLADALAAVDAAEIPDDLRPLAFGKAVDLLAGKVSPAGTGKGKQHEDDKGEDDNKDFDGDERVAKIAKRLGVAPSKLAYVYDLDDDVSIVTQRSKLSSTRSAATKEVTLLYCAARQEGGYDETHTPIASIRERVENMGVLDPNNFASHIRNIDGMTVRGNSPQNREFKVTQHGYEEAGKLVTRLTDGGS